MTSVAEVWLGLDDPEKEIAFRAMQHYLGEPGAALIRAVAAEAEAHRPEPFPYVPPPETYAALPDRAFAVDELVCPDCHQVIDGEPVALVIQVNGANRPLWLDSACWGVRMWERARGPEVAGDQLQAWPASMPIQEEP